MKILISGASGLIGQKLVKRCQSNDYDVYSLVRSFPTSDHQIQWSVTEGIINPAHAEGFDAVIHLAGDSIAGSFWTNKKKQEIRDSRVLGTNALVKSMKALAQKPKVFICASAIGFYGDRGTELLTETSPPGVGFLPEVSQEWERACQPLIAYGIRVVNLRIGIVLSQNGGALAKMLLPFKLGLGGVIGEGEQFMSWIALEDLISIIERSLVDASLSGPINAVSPNPVTNREFTKTLGKLLNRPTILRIPAWLIRLFLGEMADALLLSSSRVIPSRLLQVRFDFKHQVLDSALSAAGRSNLVLS